MSDHYVVQLKLMLYVNYILNKKCMCALYHIMINSALLNSGGFISPL